MTNKTCETCRWWDDRSGGNNLGLCRKNPANLPASNRDITDMGFWPVTIGDYDWCGEWKEKEPK